MKFHIVNNTIHNLDFWLVIAGGLKCETMEHHPGYVWYDVHAKLNTGPDDELDVGRAIFEGVVPFAGMAGQLFSDIVKTALLAQGAVPEEMRRALEDDAISFNHEEVFLAPVEWTNVYRGGDDKWFEVIGGEMTYRYDNGQIVVEAFAPLRLHKVSG